MSAHTDLSTDEICTALHDLGGVRLSWEALPDDDGDGLLEMSGLCLEDAEGQPVGWHAQVLEDGAYDLADTISDRPGLYVLSLPDRFCTVVRTS